MARSPSINRARKHQRPPRYEEQRPVLQLPLESPRWREPEVDRDRSERPDRKDERERGVVVIDFYI